MKDTQKKWNLNLNKCRNYHFELAEFNAKYPGVIEKLQKKYTKLSDFYQRNGKDKRYNSTYNLYTR